jgi:hypothetical protein
MEAVDIFERAVDYGSYLLAGPLSGLWFLAYEVEDAIATVAEWIFGDL